jgi:predicted DNA-binding antitoxin AbrB/MazE fold protein
VEFKYMSQTVDAIFDGQVLRPEEPLALEPNTRVRITVETKAPGVVGSKSFLSTAQALDLEGPADWSERLDDYLYPESSNGPS